jgi:hypothetical protein
MEERYSNGSWDSSLDQNYYAWIGGIGSGSLSAFNTYWAPASAPPWGNIWDGCTS